MQPPSSTNGPVICGYFTNWSIHAREFNVTDVARQADTMTHILYAFANLEPDGTIVLGDAWADKDIRFPAEKSVNGRAPDQQRQDLLHGNLGQFWMLKQTHRHLKVSLSVGGWSWSKNFSAVAADTRCRARFVECAIRFIKEYGLDGIDIDWEYPEDESDAFHYVHLLYELRIALDMYQQQHNLTHEPRLLLTVAVPCGPSHYRKLRLSEMAPYVDLFYLMAYDYAGSWDARTGHQAALYGGPLNGHQAVTDYIAAGVPAHKLVLGLPAYGRGFSQAGPDPGQPYSGVPKGSWEQGVYDYKALPQPGAQEFIDREHAASWSYNPSTREWVTYDTPDVISAKCDYVRQSGLAGVMFWELSGDAPADHPRSLVQTVRRAFQGNHDMMPNHQRYPESPFANVREPSAFVNQ